MGVLSDDIQLLQLTASAILAFGVTSLDSCFS